MTEAALPIAPTAETTITITRCHEADALEAQALRCRRLAHSITDLRTIETLGLIASEYEERARDLRHG